MEKISVIDINPSIIPQPQYTTECLLYRVNLSYLVLQTGFYTKEHFKNCRSLVAYNHMELRFITRVLGQIMRHKYTVLARVRYSQRVNDPRVQLSNQTGVSYFN